MSNPRWKPWVRKVGHTARFFPLSCRCRKYSWRLSAILKISSPIPGHNEIFEKVKLSCLYNFICEGEHENFSRRQKSVPQADLLELKVSFLALTKESSALNGGYLRYWEGLVWDIQVLLTTRRLCFWKKKEFDAFNLENENSKTLCDAGETNTIKRIGDEIFTLLKI